MIQSSAIYYKIKGESNEKNRNKKFSKCIQGIKYRAIRCLVYKMAWRAWCYSDEWSGGISIVPKFMAAIILWGKRQYRKNSIVVGVEDINQTKKTLDECGIKTSEIIDYEVVLVFDVFDIDGNKITFAKEV